VEIAFDIIILAGEEDEDIDNSNCPYRRNSGDSSDYA
jgi:hypothetical protein